MLGAIIDSYDSQCSYILSKYAGVTLGGSAAYSNFNPLVIVLSISVYLIIKKVSTGCNVYIRNIENMSRILAPLSLGIYVIHPLLLDYVDKSQKVVGFMFFTSVMILPTTIGVYILSVSAAHIISKIPYIKKVIL